MKSSRSTSTMEESQDSLHETLSQNKAKQMKTNQIHICTRASQELSPRYQRLSELSQHSQRVRQCKNKYSSNKMISDSANQSEEVELWVWKRVAALCGGSGRLLRIRGIELSNSERSCKLFSLPSLASQQSFSLDLSIELFLKQLVFLPCLLSLLFIYCRAGYKLRASHMLGQYIPSAISSL